MNKKIIIITILILCVLNLFSFDYTNDSFSIKSGVVSETVKGEVRTARYDKQSDMLISNYYGENEERSISETLKGLPKCTMHDPLLDFLYRMALEEILLDVNNKGHFVAGEKWDQAWTRDLSYSVILSLALLFPERSYQSLLERIFDGVILQDTGTGGSWPVSTDRVVWIYAAWETLKQPGMNKHLPDIYAVAAATMKQDIAVVWSERHSLFYGEQSFLDWREQTYPRWAEPADIARSFSLNTNVVHLLALQTLGEMASALDLKEEALFWRQTAEKLKDGINKNLFLEQRNYYAAYILDGQNPWRYEGWETLGESLAVLADIPDKTTRQSLFHNVSAGDYGISVVSPQLKNIRPYHNDGVWPFVSAYYGWATAETGDLELCRNEFAAMVRSAAMFASFKENMVASTGREKGTAVNSDRQLWSVAGYLAWIYRVFVGMRFDSDGLFFRPAMIDGLDEGIKISGFSYGNAKLSIEVTGRGNNIKSIFFDGKPVPADYHIGTNISGKHSVKIIVTEKKEDGDKIEKSKYSGYNAYTYSTGIPRIRFKVKGKKYVISADPPKKNNYQVYRDNEAYTINSGADLVAKTGKKAWVCRYVVNDKDIPQLPGNSIWIEDRKNTFLIEAEDAERQGGTFDNSAATRVGLTHELQMSKPNGRGFIKKWGSQIGDEIVFSFSAKEAGQYIIDFRYSNRLGPVNTGERCAIRELTVDGIDWGCQLFPQRGKFSVWGFSTSVVVQLDKGQHEIRLYTGQRSFSQKQRLVYIDIDLVRIRFTN